MPTKQVIASSKKAKDTAWRQKIDKAWKFSKSNESEQFRLIADLGSFARKSLLESPKFSPYLGGLLGYWGTNSKERELEHLENWWGNYSRHVIEQGEKLRTLAGYTIILQQGGVVRQRQQNQNWWNAICLKAQKQARYKGSAPELMPYLVEMELLFYVICYPLASLIYNRGMGAPWGIGTRDDLDNLTKLLRKAHFLLFKDWGEWNLSLAREKVIEAEIEVNRLRDGKYRKASETPNIWSRIFACEVSRRLRTLYGKTPLPIVRAICEGCGCEFDDAELREIIKKTVLDSPKWGKQSQILDKFPLP